MAGNVHRAARGSRVAYLGAMGIQVWANRGTPAAVAVDPAVPATALVGGAAVAGAAAGGAESGNSRPEITHMDWEALQQTAGDCRLCELHGSRTQVVFGVGDRGADWLLVGEAPGKDEDLQGEPFVGRAGQLLNAMLQAAGLRREQVYIANILKCRPPNNRDPRPEEVLCCEPYLARQIALVRPRIILALGRVAAQNLLKTDTPIGKLRGTVHRYADTGIALVATYHPAYLLRSPLDKRKAWADLRLALANAKGPTP